MDLMFGVGGVITLTVNVNDESLDLKDNNILRTVGYNFFCLWADYNPAKYVCIALYVLAQVAFFVSELLNYLVVRELYKSKQIYKCSYRFYTATAFLIVASFWYSITFFASNSEDGYMGMKMHFVSFSFVLWGFILTCLRNQIFFMHISNKRLRFNCFINFATFIYSLVLTFGCLVTMITIYHGFTPENYANYIGPHRTQVIADLTAFDIVRFVIIHLALLLNPIIHDVYMLTNHSKDLDYVSISCVRQTGPPPPTAAIQVQQHEQRVDIELPLQEMNLEEL